MPPPKNLGFFFFPFGFFVLSATLLNLRGGTAEFGYGVLSTAPVMRKCIIDLGFYDELRQNSGAPG